MMSTTQELSANLGPDSEDLTLVREYLLNNNRMDLLTKLDHHVGMLYQFLQANIKNTQAAILARDIALGEKEKMVDKARV